MAEVWFWQTVVTPHMAALAAACAAAGHRVTYVAQCAMTPDRIQQGWSVPEIKGVDVRLAGDAAQMRRVAKEAPQTAHHLFQGLRGNDLLAVAQRQLRWRGMRQWVVMEAVADAGAPGHIKRALYRALFLRYRRDLAGVLAIGCGTRDWVVARGMPAQRVFPFAYFLGEPTTGFESSSTSKMVEEKAGKSPSSCVRLLFVGRLISLKRVDLLIEALRRLFDAGFSGFSLEIVGDGPLREGLRQQAAFLGDRVTWHGAVPMPQARRHMAQADCLVLPSDHDGWGAVVSEALMAGTPVICSDACGAAEVVRASGVGAVFPAGDAAALAECLKSVLEAGAQSPQARQELAAWARCLGAEAGADYLQRIFAYMEGHVPRPRPPWQTKERT
ncbi:glycosyltransferase family 4 protein [Thermomonas alba]|uniref:glycosyltransferase family 4 protein n=1 Tax=Thermomonas alba TaxID=2888525 RepID=UPI001F04AAEA